MDTKILDQVLLPLADQFESGNPSRWFSINPVLIKDYEPFRECMAELFAEGSVSRSGNDLFRFNASGYAKYLSRIKALRTLHSESR